MIAAKSIASTATAPSGMGGADMRGAPRFKTLMRTAKLIGLTGQFLAIIRDVSDTGLKLKLFHPVPEDRMALELAEDTHFFVEKVWERGSEAGFRFSSPIDVTTFLAKLSRKDEGRIWLKTSIPGIIATGETRVLMTINSLSQQGAELKSDVLLSVDDPVVLSADGLPQIGGRIGLLCPSGYRVDFGNLIRLDELAQMMWALPGSEGDLPRPARDDRRPALFKA